MTFLAVFRFLRPALPYIGGTLAILAAMWWLDHRGYSRAMADRDRRDAALRTAIIRELENREARLIAAMSQIDATVAQRIASIEATRTELQPIIQKEIIREKRLVDPASGLTDGLLEAINRARAISACPAATDCGTRFTLPAAPSGS